MKHFFAVIMLLATAGLPALAQSLDDLNIQVHGYATQGFLYTNHNNVFYAKSSDGSPAWTEAVLNVSAQPTSQLGVGVQARYQLLGDSGNAITLDWASVDYKVNDGMGVRFGKVKTPWGLFNETQDIDPSYMWTLLPQSVYDIATRNADLTHLGGIAYGSVQMGSSAGRFDYRVWGGEQVIPTDDGQFDDLNNAGNGPKGSLSFVTYGGALRWKTPLRGLMIGASDGRNNQSSVALNGGSESFAPWNNLSYFAQFIKRKVMLAGEWNRQASAGTLDLTGLPSSSVDSDAVGWFLMGSYNVTQKFTLGAYNSQFFDHQAPLGTDRFAKDWTVSGRYDANQYLYFKAEQHFIDGTALSLNDIHNPGGLRPVYRLSAIKVGVSF